MSYFLVTTIIIFIGLFIIVGETTDPGLNQLFEHTHPLMVDRPPHQYNLWWRLLNYTANTEGLSDCYVCANTPHSTDKPFQLQPVPLPEIKTKCLIWLQAMIVGSPESSCTVWLSVLSHHFSRMGIDVRLADECASVCTYMHAQDSIPLILHTRPSNEIPTDSMPASLQVQGKIGDVAPMCICQNAGLGDRWLGYSDCSRRYVNIGLFWGPSMSSGNLWSMANTTPYQLMTNNGLQILQVYPDSVIPTSETAYLLLKERYWICGNNAYRWLPKQWSGCCYIGLLNTHLTFLSKTGAPLISRRTKRSHPEYRPHQRVSLGTKILEGFVPWYGSVHNAYLIDNISLELESFANYAIEGFHLLTDEMKNLKLVALQNRAALDYILAREGGVCAVIGDQCCTYIPDIQNNMTDVIQHMKQLREEIEKSSTVCDGTDAFSWIKNALGGYFWGLLNDFGTCFAIIVTVLLLVYVCVRMIMMLCKVID